MPSLGFLRRCGILLCSSCGHHDHIPTASAPTPTHPTAAAHPAHPTSVHIQTNSAGIHRIQAVPNPQTVQHTHTGAVRRIHSAPYPIDADLLTRKNRVGTFSVNFKNEMPSYSQLLINNQYWVHRKNAKDPHYFKWLSKQPMKAPYLYIGCSDSRMDLNEMVGVKPGGMFVYRNIANQVSVTDMGLLTVLSYAIEILGVRHIIVCGHYECGGVKAAVKMETENTLVANWVNPIKRLYTDNKTELMAIEDEHDRLNRLSELSVLQQVHNLCQTSALRAAFKKGIYPQLHGWVVDIYTGRVKEMPLPLDEWCRKGYIPSCYSTRFPEASNTAVHHVHRASQHPASA